MTDKIQTNAGELIGRALLSSMLGFQYGGDRDLYRALGYKTSLVYADFVTRYVRQDIAKAIIDRPVEATWRGNFRLRESTEDNETPLEKAWTALEKKLQLKSKFRRLDKLTNIGLYGVLFLGFNDVSSPDLEGFAKPVTSATDLLYVKPFGENHAEVTTWVTEPTSPRYGLPEFYTLAITDRRGTQQASIRVHHSRVLHVAGDVLESECEGSPVLESIYNRLMDLEKIVGSSAEMFWRGGRPGYHGKVDKDTILSDTAETDLREKLDEYDHNLRRFLLTEAIDINPLETQVADPTHAFDIQIQSICAVTGIPKRILIGSERGELASSEDRNQWLDKITTRREEYAEVQIVRPFVDRLIEVGVLPSAGKEGYTLEWADLYAATEKEQAEIGRMQSEMIRSYATTPSAERVLPVPAFLEYVMGFDQEKRKKILDMIERMVAEDETLLEPEEEEILEEEKKTKEEV